MESPALRQQRAFSSENNSDYEYYYEQSALGRRKKKSMEYFQISSKTSILFKRRKRLFSISLNDPQQLVPHRQQLVRPYPLFQMIIINCSGKMDRYAFQNIFF